MANVELKNAYKRYGDVEVIRGVDLKLNSGDFVVFVGPSGCGKSTLLRMVAGLEEVSEGEIHIADRDVTHVEAVDRGIAMVFQSYALYPHMSVAENMGFGLRMNGVDKAEVDKKVMAAAKTLQLDQLLDRKPKNLSGGQRQRVAIGRAIVRNPDVFLFDEPLSNLDAELRVEMRLQIARLHHSMGATMIYVTHDQVEAMTMADKIVVLRAGIVEQMGSPLELYHHPENLFVAGFIGSPRMNFIEGKLVCVRKILATLRAILVYRCKWMLQSVLVAPPICTVDAVGWIISWCNAPGSIAPQVAIRLLCKWLPVTVTCSMRQGKFSGV